MNEKHEREVEQTGKPQKRKLSGDQDISIGRGDLIDDNSRPALLLGFKK